MNAKKIKKVQWRRLPVVFAVGVLLSGCSQMPQYQPPQVDVQENIISTERLAISDQLKNEADFWQQFSADQTLQMLLLQAVQYNFDLAKAKLNLQMAEAYLKQADAKLLPQLGLQLNAGMNQTSDNSYPQGQGAQFGQLGLAGLVSYELDIWGKNEANQQASLNLYQATQADQQAVQLSVKAAVTEIYLSLQALQQQLKIADKTAALRQQNVELRESQLQYGSISALSLHQAKAELSAIKMVKVQLNAAYRLQINALAQLLGYSPQALLKNDFQPEDAGWSMKTIKLPSFLSSDVMQRRPDIIAAEARLKAANANIGVAKAALLPSLSLTGLLGFQSEALSRLLRDDSVAWNAQTNVDQSLFDGGSRQADVEFSEAQYGMMLVNYRQIVTQAFAEVSDGLIQLQNYSEQIDLQKQQIEQLKQAFDLAQARFDAGYASYLEVLDTQRGLLDAELNLVSVQQQYQTAAVYLYKALGGIWQNSAQSANP
ncbi:efflux transporter outer membrane subunit [Thiomicrorhabdus sediminis]|uniref:Efflux transporter outer membrane subunit n=1 Tax=Thiomicrorhabdus sediminis TaxID=2580412 RepID=A0A4P9K689_9GAMM|nr:efflux transporter outer membrane subunit [Thiomicrorhabdus sediminis]QCU90552.1 efflux transporter outer membrane subunit [Thiomicrorhabdus sediminis]